MTGTFVQPPTVQPRPNSILSVATVVTSTDENEFYGGTEHEPEACGLAGFIPDACLNTYATILWTPGEEGADGTVTITIDNPIAGHAYSYQVNGAAATPIVDGEATFDVPMADDPEAMSILVLDDGAVLASGSATLPDEDALIVLDFPGKDFSGFGTVHGTPFALYAGIECYLNGDTSYEARAARKLELSEAHGIESRLWNTILPQGAEDITPTPGTAVSILEGVALLESAIAQEFPGVPTLHVGVGTAVFARDAGAVFSEGQLVTAVGTPVVAGTGYTSQYGPDGRLAGSGEAWLYMTGPVMVRRSSTFVAGAPDQRTNRLYALAERKYIVTYDCAALAVLVDTTS